MSDPVSKMKDFRKALEDLCFADGHPNLTDMADVLEEQAERLRDADAEIGSR